MRSWGSCSEKLYSPRSLLDSHHHPQHLCRTWWLTWWCDPSPQSSGICVPPGHRAVLSVWPQWMHMSTCHQNCNRWVKGGSGLLAHAASSCHLVLFCSGLDVALPSWYAAGSTRSCELIDLTASSSLWIVLAARSSAVPWSGAPPLPGPGGTHFPQKGVQLPAAGYMAWSQNPGDLSGGFPTETGPTPHCTSYL